MVARFALAAVALGFPAVLVVKITRQRRLLGKSPVILGTGPGWQAWFERIAPIGLLFWPVVWACGALGGMTLATGTRLAVGLISLLAGGLLSASSVFLMGRAWRIGLDPENRTDLADSGPYRWIRHPIYGGMLVMLLGSVLVLRAPLVEVAAIITAVGFLFQALREERHMLGTLGERYAAYMARTGRFVPRLRAR
ncbi:MAG TPA: isoprenylcysteine carboxylmethyltransferase family protein [Polyangia bacterium]|nr:isoprenylcysteine carboxylmethyltransferase family protein [Polyangia bacterium]